MSAQDTVDIMEIISKNKPFFMFLVVVFVILYNKHKTVICSSIIKTSLQPKYLDLKATDCAFFYHYILQWQLRNDQTYNMAKNCLKFINYCQL